MYVRDVRGNILGTANVPPSGLHFTTRSGSRFILAYYSRVVDGVKRDELCVKLLPGQSAHELPGFQAEGWQTKTA